MALVLTLTTLGQGSPAQAQQQAVPDARTCAADTPPPSNSTSLSAISVTVTVFCWTDSSRQTPGQVASFEIRIELFNEFGPVGNPKVARREAPSDQFTTTLTYPDPASTEFQPCLSGRYFAKVTASVRYKSGEPPTASGNFTTDSRFVTCETTMPPQPPIPLPPIPDPDPTPTPTPEPDPTPTPEPDPNPTPDPNPEPDPGGGPGSPCRFPCTPPQPGDPPA